MKAKELQNFLERALSDPAHNWQQDTMQSIGALHVPEQLLGEYPSLFRGDIHRLWADWFVGECVDVHKLVHSDVSYPYIYSEVNEFCIAKFGLKDSVRTLAKSLAKIANSEVLRLKNIERRKSLSIEERQTMIDLTNGDPRCWVCGYRFLPEAVDNFLECTHYPLKLPLLVDIFKPIGIFERDLQIEVDHIHPYSKGGGKDENLRIACGWCNRNKSNNSSFYDVAGVDRRIKTHDGYCSLPQPFWVVRLLAILGASENSNHTTKSHELTVTLRNLKAKATPQNLVVRSYDDGVPSSQFQSRENVLRMIK